VYPISSLNPPSTPTSKDEKRAIEDQEAERRRKIIRGSPNCLGGLEPEDWWSMDRVDSFYRECCQGCEEEPDPAVSAAFKVHFPFPSTFKPYLISSQHASTTNPRTLDLSGVQLNLTTASILSDVFTIEWG
jgi:protein phosphatase 1 regulatory subunit 37